MKLGKNYQSWQIQANHFPKKANFSDQCRFLLTYATLAPNSHNTQPWQFRIKEKSVEFLMNFSRRLLYSDRAFREAYISLGCSLANFLIASSNFGFSPFYEYLPESSLNETCVTINLKSNKNVRVPKELFSELSERRTNRSPHLKKIIPQSLLAEAIRLNDEPAIKIHFVTTPKLIREVGDLVKEASVFAFSDQEFKNELSEWIRPNTTIKPDGMTMSGFNMPTLISYAAPLLVRHVPPQIQAAQDYKLVTGSQGLMIISANLDTKEEWLATGKTYEYLALFFTKHGIATAPMAGIVEYEVTNKKLQQLLGISDRPMFFARIGYPSSTPPHTPRLPIEDLLV